MSELSLMMFDEGFDRGIRCRFITKWLKIDSYVFGTEKLLFEIERIKPDIVVLDLDLYKKIDGIKTSKMIRRLFNIPVLYV
jgi:DNA-binding response OmpR family regulator